MKGWNSTVTSQSDDGVTRLISYGPTFGVRKTRRTPTCKQSDSPTMYFHHFTLLHLTTSKMPQWLYAIRREAAALNITEVIQKSDYQPHPLIHRSLMTLQSAIISSVSPEISALVMRSGFTNKPACLITPVRQYNYIPCEADHRALWSEFHSICLTMST